jgi:hypothetical protein
LILITLMALVADWPAVFSWMSVFRVVAALYGCWHFWQLPITHVQEIVSDPELVASLRARAKEMMPKIRALPKWEVVLLFESMEHLDAPTLGAVAKRAFGHPFQILDKELDPTEGAFLPSEHDEPVVAGRLPNLLCYEPPHLLGVFPIDCRYAHDWNGDEPAYRDKLHHPKLPPHNAFFAVVLLPHASQIEPVENGYRWTCRLAASLASTRSLSVYLPDKQEVFQLTPAIQSALASDDPLQSLESSRRIKGSH